MQKKLVALAVMGVLAAPAAMADVTVYGGAQLSVNMDSVDAANAGDETSATSVTSNSSRIGLKGTEELKNGMTLSYKIERQISWDNNEDDGQIQKARDTYVAVKGDFGTVVVGRHSTPYKKATKDIFSNTRGDYNSIMGLAVKKNGVGHNLRVDNVIAYISPELSGLSVFAAYVPDAGDDSVDNTVDLEAFSVAANYKRGPLKAALAYEVVNNAVVVGTTGTDDDAAVKASVTYKVADATSLGLVWESIDAGTDASNKELTQDNVYLSVVHGLSDATKLKFAYAQAGDVGGTSDTGAMQYTLGVSTKASKNTEFYALYTNLTADKDAKGYKLNGGQKLEAMGKSGNDKVASSFSVGVVHKFASM